MIVPGARLLTVTPNGATSAERVLAIAVTPDRKALERRMFGIGWRTEMDVMFTIRPRPDSLRAGSAALVSRTVLISVRLYPVSQASTGVDSKVPGGGPPALQTRISSPPSVASAASTAFSGEPGWARSTAR